MYARVTYATKYTKQSARVTNVTIKQKIELVTNLRQIRTCASLTHRLNNGGYQSHLLKNQSKQFTHVTKETITQNRINKSLAKQTHKGALVTSLSKENA